MEYFYLKSGAGATHRANTTLYTSGDKMVIALADVTSNYLVARRWVWECTTTGVSSASSPAWPSSVTQDVTTVTDGAAVWTARKAGFSSGSTASWAFSHIRMDWLTTAMVAGDTMYVSNNHAGSSATAIIIALPGTLTSPNRILCVNDGVASPTALATTSSEITNNTGSNGMNISITGSGYVYGISFGANPFATTAYAAIFLNGSSGNSNDKQTYELCTFKLPNYNFNVNSISMGFGDNANGSMEVFWVNCNYDVASGLLSNIGLNRCSFVWKGGTLVSPVTNILSFAGATGHRANVLIDGVDLSVNGASRYILASGLLATAKMFIRNCKINSALAGLMSGTIACAPGKIEMYNCDSADTNYKCWVELYMGSIKDFTTLYPAGTDGIKLNTVAVPLSYKMASNSSCQYPLMPLVGMDRIVVNEVTSSQTATLEIIHNESALLKDNEVWAEVDYPLTSGSTQFTTLSDCAADVLATGSTQTASTVAWDSGLSARANSTPYSIGSIIKLASNAGRAFICTASSGNSAGSEPGGYATAVDGDSITDGSCTFKAMKRQKLVVTFTAAEQGVLRIRPVLAKPSTTIYVGQKAGIS